MQSAVIQALKTIVGGEHAADSPTRFLRIGQEAPGLTMVSPGTVSEILELFTLARENGVDVITCNDLALLPEDLGRQGLLLDFSRMNAIERIDTRNLVAHVERGVTWDQLNAELKKQGVKTVAPVAANSLSVAECAAARVVGKAVSRLPDYPLMNLKVVLADGTIHKTGTHALSEEGADGRHHDGGACLSTWYIGADDVFGVVVRASIMLWPVCESRSCQVYTFDRIAPLLAAL